MRMTGENDDPARPPAEVPIPSDTAGQNLVQTAQLVALVALVVVVVSGQILGVPVDREVIIGIVALGFGIDPKLRGILPRKG
jgi:hypothetical protein